MNELLSREVFLFYLAEVEDEGGCGGNVAAYAECYGEPKGPVVHLVERFICNEEVCGSSPHGSTSWLLVIGDVFR